MVGTLGRVFAAVPLPPDIRMALADRTSVFSIPGKLVPPKNWHLTLRFLGIVDEVTYERFLAGMSGVEGVSPFPIKLGSLGGFPNERRATVLWVDVIEGVETLGQLNEIAEEAARAAGLEPEERPYQPHLTLSRIRPPEDIGPLTSEKLDLRWSCDGILIYESRFNDGGVRYEPLETFTFFG